MYWPVEHRRQRNCVPQNLAPALQLAACEHTVPCSDACALVAVTLMGESFARCVASCKKHSNKTCHRVGPTIYDKTTFRRAQWRVLVQRQRVCLHGMVCMALQVALCRKQCHSLLLVVQHSSCSGAELHWQACACRSRCRHPSSRERSPTKNAAGQEVVVCNTSCNRGTKISNTKQPHVDAGMRSKRMTAGVLAPRRTSERGRIRQRPNDTEDHRHPPRHTGPDPTRRARKKQGRASPPRATRMLRAASVKGAALLLACLLGCRAG